MATPSISLSYISGSGCSGGEGATIDVPVTLSASVDSGILAGTYTFTWNVYDGDGNLTDTDTETLIPYNNNPADFPFIPTQFPFYKVETIIDNGVDDPVTEEMGISILNQYTIYVDSCNNYSIKNCSLSDTVTVRIIDFSGTQVGEDQTLLPQTTISFTVPSDGVYYANLYDDTGTVIFTFIVIEYCSLLSCLSSRIKSVLCSCDPSQTKTRCKDYCTARYDLNRIGLIAFDLFNRLNMEYSLNIIYSALDNAKIVELSSIQRDFDVIGDLCSTCNDDLSGFEGVAVKKTSSSSDCGCGCS